MGHKKKGEGRKPTSLGRALVKSKKLGRAKKGQFLAVHVTEYVEDKKEKLVSVTERSDLDEFLMNALLAEKDFTAARGEVVQVRDDGRASKLVLDEEAAPAHTAMATEIPIPRRPKWDAETTPDELDRMERESFLVWRRKLAEMEEDAHLALTPFEKNLEIWRQLWRVVERSHVVVQIVDARNPLLYRCLDLEKYVKEVSPDKEVMLVINKADFLTPSMRRMWGNYFQEQGIGFVFFSANNEQLRLQADEKERRARQAEEDEANARKEQTAAENANRAPKRKKPSKKAAAARLGFLVGNTPLLEVDEGVEGLEDEEGEGEAETKEDKQTEKQEEEQENKGDNVESTPAPSAETDGVKSTEKDNEEDGGQDDDEEEEEDGEDDEDEEEEEEDEEKQQAKKAQAVADSDRRHLALNPDTERQASSVHDPVHIMNREELLKYLKHSYSKKVPQRPPRSSAASEAAHAHEDKLSVGFVGYPNVGKSSTINVLYAHKKVRVGATPGKTKHFQTLMLREYMSDGEEVDMMLCDCPGLVFPTTTTSKSELMVSGVLSIDHMRDPLPPIQLLCQRISPAQFFSVYGLVLPNNPTGTPVTADVLLDAHARLRSFWKDHGRPEVTKSARLLLKDFVAGRLLYCHPPPTLNEEQRRKFFTALFRKTMAAAALANPAVLPPSAQPEQPVLEGPPAAAAAPAAAAPASGAVGAAPTVVVTTRGHTFAADEDLDQLLNPKAPIVAPVSTEKKDTALLQDLLAEDKRKALAAKAASGELTKKERIIMMQAHKKGRKGKVRRMVGQGDDKDIEVHSKGITGVNNFRRAL